MSGGVAEIIVVTVCLKILVCWFVVVCVCVWGWGGWGGRILASVMLVLSDFCQSTLTFHHIH